MKKANYSKENLEKIVSESKSYADIIRALGLVMTNHGSGSYKTVRKYIKLYNIDTSHFYTHSERIKITKPQEYSKRKPNNEVFIKGEALPNTTGLKTRILKNNLMPYECSVCKIVEWQNKKLSLQLDHINGDNTDHRLENLRFICPNCHSQTDTYAGKNKKDKKKTDFNCCICFSKINRKAKSCSKCLILFRKPTKIKLSLIEIIEKLKTKTCVALGKELNVSDVCIKKFIKSELIRKELREKYNLDKNNNKIID